jgi:hypothetical protein
VNPIVCSVIIPSRNRPDGLLKAIHSINSTVHNPSSIEILVGLDDDDLVSTSRVEEFEAIDNVTVFVWPRAWLEMISLLCRMATGDWIVILNDDATIEAEGIKWDLQLAGMPTTGFVLQPEIYRLNESRYPNATRTGFPWFPNRCWEAFKCGDFIPYPADYAVCDLADKHGWEIRFLKGVTVFHDRHA